MSSTSERPPEALIAIGSVILLLVLVLLFNNFGGAPEHTTASVSEADAAAATLVSD
ncbi:MAG: hypothetical protein QGF46_03000 [Planctomycetota bacterium]|nr:hypothetical protein [Planctomycetota bacterium]